MTLFVGEIGKREAHEPGGPLQAARCFAAGNQTNYIPVCSLAESSTPPSPSEHLTCMKYYHILPSKGRWGWG